MWLGLLVKEAVHSVALEHPDNCACDICLAAGGDVDALTRIFVAVADARDRDETV